jgi:hypothetical protein
VDADWVDDSGDRSASGDQSASDDDLQSACEPAAREYSCGAAHQYADDGWKSAAEYDGEWGLPDDTRQSAPSDSESKSARITTAARRWKRDNGSPTSADQNGHEWSAAAAAFSDVVSACRSVDCTCGTFVPTDCAARGSGSGFL